MVRKWFILKFEVRSANWSVLRGEKPVFRTQHVIFALFEVSKMNLGVHEDKNRMPYVEVGQL